MTRVEELVYTNDIALCYCIYLTSSNGYYFTGVSGENQEKQVVVVKHRSPGRKAPPPPIVSSLLQC